MSGKGSEVPGYPKQFGNLMTPIKKDKVIFKPYLLK